MPASKSLSHSYSALTMFDQCPAKYKYIRLDKAVVDKGNKYTQYGQEVHKAFEKRLADGVAFPKGFDNYEATAQAAMRAAKGGEISCELQLAVDKEHRPCTWFSRDAWMRAIIDMLVVYPDGRALAVDWKTGKRKTDTRQSTLSAWMVFRHFPAVDKVRTAWVWLKEGHRAVDTDDYTRDGMTAVPEEIQAIVSRIEKAKAYDKFPARPSGLCPWCPAKGVCPSARL